MKATGAEIRVTPYDSTRTTRVLQSRLDYAYLAAKLALSLHGAKVTPGSERKMNRYTFSELVSAIYDGAVDFTLWPQTLGQICETLGFRKGTIDLNRVPDMSNLFNFHYGIDDQQAAAMVSYYPSMPEVWGGLEAIMTRPIGQPWIVSRIMTQEALVQTPYYQNWVGPMGLIDGAAIVLARDPTLFGSIRLATDAKRGFVDDYLAEELKALLPHCQRAARINGLLDAS